MKSKTKPQMADYGTSGRRGRRNPNCATDRCAITLGEQCLKASLPTIEEIEEGLEESLKDEG